MSKNETQVPIIDYISVCCNESGVFRCVYTDDIKGGNDEAVDYLKREKQLEFLAKDGLVLFHTRKSTDSVEASYEYKLGPLSDEEFERFVRLWERNSADQIRRLVKEAEKRVYCFGIEYPHGRKEDFDRAVLKIYFSAWKDGACGEKIYDDKEFSVKPANISEQFEHLKDIADKFVEMGFHFYMAAWNWDKATDVVKYKIYLINAENTCSESFWQAAEDFVGCELKTKVNNMTKEDDLYLNGLALCLDTAGNRSVNIYFRQKKYRIKGGLICRNIAEIFFVIDSGDKRLYRDRRITCVNRMGCYMIEQMIKKKEFSVSDICRDVEDAIVGERPPSRVIEKDVADLIASLKDKGWLYEQV